MLHRIRNADIYAPEPLGLGHLLVAGGRLVYVGQELPQLDPELLGSDIDLRGARLIPGLIDAHAHITGGGGEDGFATQVAPVPALDFSNAGITTVVGLLGTDDITRSTSNLIARTYGLREQGLSAWCYTGGYHLPPTTLTGSVRSDIVHVECILGVGELAISDHRSSQPSLDELARIAGEAHVAGLMTRKAGIVHLHLGDGQRGLEPVRRLLADTEIPARVFNPTHCNRRKGLFEEACELTRQGCWIDLTAFPVAEDEDAFSAADGLGRFLQAGYPADKVTVSSDSGGCLPVFNAAGEVVSLDYARAGDLLLALAAAADQIGLARALPAFTDNIARLLRLPRKGRIAVGCDADLAVIDENFAIFDVMALGAWRVREAEVQNVPE